MSIRILMQHRLVEGRLHLLRPRYNAEPVRRTMLVSSEMKRLLDGPWNTVDAELRCSRLRADLDAFVIGDPLTVCLTPRLADKHAFARLDRPETEIWAIRSRDPSPGLRVLGAFAARDSFVALSCWPRSRPIEWLSRPILGANDSGAWAEAIGTAVREWDALFAPFPRHGNGGDDVGTYFSSGAVVV